jgi:hypothetical protein
MEGRRSSILAMVTVKVSAVRLHSTHLKTLSTSPAGGPPAPVGLSTVVGPASGREHHRVLTNFVGRTGPTYVHSRYTIFNIIYTYKNDIYKKKKKKLNSIKNMLPISPRSSPGGMGMS